MDISKKNEAVASKKHTSNASKISLQTTEVPPNNNKESWAYSDDSILFNDWLDVEDEKNQSDTAESPPFVVTEEIPVKEKSPSSDVIFASPKRKKPKFLNFDEILENLTFDVLNLNFTKLLVFLESSNKEQAFPFTLKQYEEFFIMIVEDVNILKSKSLDESYRDICDKIFKAASGYLLTYVYEYKMDLHKLVMVIKKDNMMDQSEEATAPLSCSKECIKASSQKSSEVDTKKPSGPKESPITKSSPVTISSGFKIHCLRTLLGFIKFDEAKTKEFPELSPDQARYMQSLLEGEEVFDDRSLEVKELGTALREVMKIYSLKYDFRIKCVDIWTKNLTFEKIPKQKSGTKSGTDGDLNQTRNLTFEKIPKQKSGTKSGTDGDLNQTRNLTFEKLPKQNSGTEPETDGDSNQAMSPKSVTSKPETPDVVEHCFKIPEISTFQPVQQKPVLLLSERMLRRQKKLADNEDLAVKSLPPEGVSAALNSIIEFLLDDEKLKLVFVAKNQAELCFYRHVFSLCRTGYSLSNLGEEFERLLYKISSLLPRFHIIRTIPINNRINKTAGIKEVTYTKQLKCVPVDLDSAQRNLTNEEIPKQKSGTEPETDGDSNQAINLTNEEISKQKSGTESETDSDSNQAINLTNEEIPKQKSGTEPETDGDSNQAINLTNEEISKQKSGTESETDGDSNQAINLTNEEIPKQKSGTEIDGDSNQAMNPKSETENLAIAKSETAKLETAKSETAKLETAKSETAKLKTAKPETAKLKTPDVAEHCFKKPEIPKFKPVQRKPVFLTKRMLKRQLKVENEVLVVKSLSPEDVSATLNVIIEFLLDDEKLVLVFVPRNQAETCFYRKVFKMCRTGYSLTSLGEEFGRLHYRISSLLPRFIIKPTIPRKNKINQTTGIKEVTYIKQIKFAPVALCSTQRNLTFDKIPQKSGSKSATESGTDSDSNQAMNPKSEISKLVTQKSETPDVAENYLKKLETPKFQPVQQKPVLVTNRMLQRQITAENEVLFVKRLPPKDVSAALNSIIEFLLDDENLKLVFVPKNQAEFCFCREVFNLCRTGSLISLGEEFERLRYRISSLLPRFKIRPTMPKYNRINETTGFREVTYFKELKFPPVELESVQSAPKKRKVNLQNALDLAGQEQIRLASVIDLNQSLRKKKKTKKQKKAKLKANAFASNGESPKLSNKASKPTHIWSDDSSSECSSRATSRDRAGAVPKAQPGTRRAGNENTQSFRIRRAEALHRQEQLMEALSVPVQSDKAVRMMRGMGWSGGALGARGNGIKEPITLNLDFARGAGLGHIRRTETTARKPKETKTAPSWVSENQKVIEKAEDGIIVKKTKDLLLKNPTFDLMEPPNSNSKVELSEPDMHDICVIVSEHFSRIEFLISIHAFLIVNAPYKTLKYLNQIPKKEIKFVRSTLAVINKRKVNYGIFQKNEFSLYTQIHVKYKNMDQNFFIDLKILGDHKTIELTKKLSFRETPTKQMPTQWIPMPTEWMPTDLLPLTQQELVLPSSKGNAVIITEESILSHISSTKTECNSLKSFSMLKFKVRFLMNILNFVKSENEESEVTFSKILTSKEKCYIPVVIDEVNMRINFGSSAAEQSLCQEIKKHVKDAFLAAMFNHHYTVVTLNKYFRIKRLNRPDNAVKHKCQTTFNLDICKSETVSEDKIKISEPTESENNNNGSKNNNVAENDKKLAENDKKFAENEKKLAENDSEVTETNSTFSEDSNKVAENSNNEEILPESSDDDITNPYDSDESSVEEYNNKNATATVPRLPPGEDGVDLSNFIYLYDSETPNTIGVNNKNNIGNGNTVIDNIQIVDINMTENEKNDVDTEMAEHLVCVDYTEEVIEHNKMTVDTKKEKMVNTGNEMAGLNDQPNKRSDTVANDVLEVGKKGVDMYNIEKPIDDVLSNTEGPANQKAINAGDVKSNVESCEDIATDDIKNVTGNPSENIKDPDFIMKEDAIEKMEVISINDKEDLLKVTNKGKTSKIKEKSTVNLSDDQNVKQEAKNIEIKTDGGRLTKENLVLSNNNCDTQSVAVKAGTEIDVPNSLKDSEIKLVRIVHINHPFTKLTKEKIKEIQRDISNSIILTTELPLLECHGVQKDALIYTCHNKKTYDWLQNTISVASYVEVLSADEVTKMAVRLYCLFDNHCVYVCKMIELYNKGLSTKNWVVEKTEKDGDYVTFIIKMDKISIKYIQESGFALFAGVDKVQFSPIWE